MVECVSAKGAIYEVHSAETRAEHSVTNLARVPLPPSPSPSASLFEEQERVDRQMDHFARTFLIPFHFNLKFQLSFEVALEKFVE